MRFQRFREYVGDHVLCWDPFEGDDVVFNGFPYKVVSDVNMFGSFVEHWVHSEFDAASIVPCQSSGTSLIEANIFE